MANPLRIVKVVNCTGPLGLGLNEGLERAMRLAKGAAILDGEPEDSPETDARCAAEVAAWFKDKFDSGDLDNDKDVTEFRFPAGRVNNGWTSLTRQQCAKWQKLEGPIWSGFKQFFDALTSEDKARVQIALPFPTKKPHVQQITALFGETKIASIMPGGRESAFVNPNRPALRFEDLGSLAPQFMARVKPLLDAGYRVGADTVPTDNIGQPGLATRFDLPRGYERVTWGVRARIVAKWLRVAGAPISRAVAMRVYDGLPADWPRLSLLLTGDADDVMPVADLERVRPLLAEIRCQNVKDGAMKEWIAAQRSNA